MVDKKEINLEEKLRKLIGDKKKEESEKKVSKENSKIDQEKLEKGEIKNFQSKPQIKLDSSVSLGPRLGINNTQPAQQNLEQSIFEERSAMSPPTTPHSEHTKKELAYQEAKMNYDLIDQAQTGREPSQIEAIRNVRVQDNFARRTGMTNLRAENLTNNESPDYSLQIQGESKKKNRWEVSNEDLVRKYAN